MGGLGAPLLWSPGPPVGCAALSVFLVQLYALMRRFGVRGCALWMTSNFRVGFLCFTCRKMSNAVFCVYAFVLYSPILRKYIFGKVASTCFLSRVWDGSEGDGGTAVIRSWLLRASVQVDQWIMLPSLAHPPLLRSGLSGNMRKHRRLDCRENGQISDLLPCCYL